MRRSPAPLLLLAALLGGARGASADIGSLKGTKPGDLAFPLFNDADTCNQCHGGGVDGDTSYLPSDTWAGTMMANAARDPVFFAALTVANQDAPGVGTYCLRCHSPIGFVQGHATPPDGSAFDDTDRQGVGCETCHRATQTPPPDGPYYLSDAQLVFTDDTSKHGPYDMVDSPAHTTVVDTGPADPRFCGQCHQVTNPDVHLRDAAGMDTGLEFPLDTTYAEWSASAFAKVGAATYQGCADCHMPRKLGDHAVTSIFDPPLRKDPRGHGFVGGNHWGIQAVMAANPDRAKKYPKPFDLALQRTQESLASAVKVTLTSAPASGTPGQPITVKVKVENLTGHKFPTGYAESRRAWIGIALVDASQNETVLLGGFDVPTGAIQATPPTRVYRAQHGSWDGMKGQVDEHLALHDMVLSDTRIPPSGFVAGVTTQPSKEIDYSDGSGGLRSFDEASFTLDTPASLKGTLTLSARVYYQSMTREYVEFLKTANTTNTKGAELETIFHATGDAAPLLIASAEAKVAFGGDAGSGGGGGSGGGSGGGGGSESGHGGSGGSGGGSASRGGCGCEAAGGAGSTAAGATALLLLAALATARGSPRRGGGSRRRGSG